MPTRISHLVSREFPAVDWGAFEWAIVESPNRTALLRMTVPPTFKAGLLPAGVAFGDRRELRWQKRRSGMFHLVMVDDDGAALDEQTARPVEEIGTDKVLLWGEPRDGHWHEARIPREIGEYPPEFQGHVLAVEVMHYELRLEEGPVFLYRCKRLVKVEGR